MYGPSQVLFIFPVGVHLSFLGDTEKHEKDMCNRLTSMKHIEVHVIESPHDLHLATTAGLLEDVDTPLIITCGLCESLVVLGNNDAPAHVVLAGKSQAITCDKCLGLALQTFIVYD